MRIYKARNRNGGFSLLETLLTVAILTILVGLSFVGIARYRDYLKVAELDNAARDIYMAAQNRAVLLQNSGRLGADATLLSAIKKDVGGSAIWMLSHDSTKLDELLPIGSVDPALREGHFRVVYDKDTGYVTEAFYTDREIGINDAKLNDYRQDRSTRVSNKDLVGHYNGDAPAVISTKPLPTPGVEILINNGDELTLTVKYTVPAGVTADRKPLVRLEYRGKKVTLLGDAAADAPMSPRASSYDKDITNTTAATATYTWVLDSLDAAKQFQGLGGGLGDLGDDFTVTAGLKLEAGGYIDSAYYVTGSDNSLFAKGSTYNTTDGTAQIANLRHLQNLCLTGDGFTSKVGSGITKAEQLCDIDCEKYLGSDWKFFPIVNSNLESYNGKYNDKNTHIYNLSTKETDNAGLFGTVSGDLKIENCRVCWTVPEKLVNTNYVYAISGKKAAGGLIGSVSAGNVTIKNSFAATTAEGKNSTASVGGLVGSVSGGSLEIKNSYADCYLKGGANASVGGLVGSGNVNKLENCYAAGFIVDPTTDTETAGLVNGDVTAASNTYSVVRTISGVSLGFPNRPLYNGVDYIGGATVRYLNDTSTAFNPTGNVFVTSPETHPYNLRHKLNSTAEKLEPPYIFRGLRDTEGYAIPHYGDWCGAPPAVIRGMVYYEEYYHEGKTNTNAYGIPNDSNYVGAAGKFVVDGGVYTNFTSYPLWDDYGNGDNKKNNPVVVRDGYALLFMGGSVALGKYEVRYGDAQIWTLEAVDGELTWSCEWAEGYETKYGETPPNETARSFTLPRDKDSEPDACKELSEENYVLVLLPDAVVTGNFAYGDSFYQKLAATKVGDAGEGSKDFFFNPLFARTVEAGDMTAGANPGKVYIRTARHLYDLSRFYDLRYLYNDEEKDLDDNADMTLDKDTDYYRTNNYYHKNYYFEQELDIDYDTYTWYGSIPGKVKSTDTYIQHPIGLGVDDKNTGALNSAFWGIYDGGYHIIRNVFFRGTNGYLGLFGLFGEYDETTPGGSQLRNVIYEMDPEKTQTINANIEINSRAVGALVGKNYGVVENCAVYGVNMSATSKFIGGLAGYNQNIVKNCAAEVVSLTANFPSTVSGAGTPCAGGLVGSQYTDNNATIENSYAVGKLVKGNGQGAIAGLVATDGYIKNSYAAVDLVSSGNRYGLSGVVSSNITNSYWLKDVFVYRGEKYNITSTTDYNDSDRGRSFAELKTSLTSLAAQQNTVLNIPNGASYTPTYKGKVFPYLTGVKTTLSRGADGLITGKGTVKSIHYGLWPTPLPVGLAYYEVYSDGTYGVNGQFENTVIASLIDDTDSRVVKRDGYALVFDVTDGDVPLGDYKIKYGNGATLNGTTLKEFTLTRTANDWKWNNWSYAGDIYTVTVDSDTADSDTVDSVKYTLVSLPHSVVTGNLSEGDVRTAKYFQKLVYGEGLFSERTFYFNPHFAGRLKQVNGAATLVSVEAGTVKDNAEYTAPTAPIDPDEPGDPIEPGKLVEPKNGSFINKYVYTSKSSDYFKDKNSDYLKVNIKVKKKDENGNDIKDANGNYVYEYVKDEHGNIVWEYVIDEYGRYIIKDRNGSYAKVSIMDFDQIKTACEPNAISVRTPRHFYALSRYQEAYCAENKTGTPGWRTPTRRQPLLWAGTIRALSVAARMGSAPTHTAITCILCRREHPAPKPRGTSRMNLEGRPARTMCRPGTATPPETPAVMQEQRSARI